MPDESKVCLASIHLDSIVLQWQLNCMPDKFDVYPPWSKCLADIALRFGPLYDDMLTNLIQVKHTNSVQEYTDASEFALTLVSLLQSPSTHRVSLRLA